MTKMFSHEERMQYVRSLCDERMLEEDCPVDYLDFDTPFITTNGIDMGNPGTKGALTLLALLAEEQASLASSKVEMNVDFFEDEASMFWFNHAGAGSTVHDETVSMIRARVFKEEKLKASNPSMTRPTDWTRTDEPYGKRQVEKVKQPSIFSTAGDDQAAGGSREKVTNLTHFHRFNQMIVADDKDLVSPLLVVYCGRYAVRTRENRMRVAVTDSDYDSHMMVDDVLIRLFSPVSKAQESSNEPNPAIGKAKVLETKNSQLPLDWHIVRDNLTNTRFKQRMFAYLPRTTKGSIDPIVELPTSLGGLGLGPITKECIDSLSENHVILIRDLLNRDPDDRIKRALHSFMRDRYARGIDFENNVFDEAMENLSESIEPKPVGLRSTLQREGLLEEFNATVSYYAKRRKIGQLGYYGSRELKELFRRCLVQQDLLNKENITKGWNDASWPQRRKAYEETLSVLVMMRELEMRYEETPIGAVDRQKLFEAIRYKTLQEFKEFHFDEDVFYHLESTFTESDTEEVRYPVREILQSFPTLELPPITNRGWFPTVYEAT